MIGVYFSGTGNTRYCVERLTQAYEPAAETVSIESELAVQKIQTHDEIILGYPVQFSNIPKILQDFIDGNSCIWKSKKIFVVATMGLFSGDGAGILARLLARHGAVIIGGLHLKMPDSIGDEKVLKRTLAQNQALVLQAKQKIERTAQALKSGCPPQEGMGLGCRLAGLFGQRLYFSRKTKQYSDRLKIDPSRCIQCGTCVSVCPMKNISLREAQAVPGGRCTMCYRCVSLCPVQAITLLGKRVYQQSRVETYL